MFSGYTVEDSAVCAISLGREFVVLRFDGPGRSVTVSVTSPLSAGD